MGSRLASLRREGKLKVNAGRIESVTPADGRLRVHWSPRDGAPAELTVDLLVNATGPDYAVARGGVPLLNSLRAAGLVSEDALHLGLRTAGFGACVGAQGRVTDGLYYLGPMLRAGYWEATAAAELRDHAERLAAYLAACPG